MWKPDTQPEGDPRRALVNETISEDVYARGLTSNMSTIVFHVLEKTLRR